MLRPNRTRKSTCVRAAAPTLDRFRLPTARRVRSLTRLLACLVLALLSLSSKSAFAISRVPMCGMNAETVIAPPISRAAQDSPLAPTGCESKIDTRWESGQPRRAPAELPSVELVPRVPPVRFWLPRGPCTRVPLSAEVNGERAAHRSNLERPPR